MNTYSADKTTFLLLMLLLLTASAAQADEIFRTGFETEPPGKLNDTGQDWCANTTAIVTCPESLFPDQDGDHGRDALARNGQLQKIGFGSAGFDYTKISNLGQPLPENAPLGTGPNDYACLRDNHTGLLWEVKTTDPLSLRYFARKYAWYDTNPATNGGNPGDLGQPLECNQTLSNCNTAAFVAAVNTQGLCGYSDWRLPTPDELLGTINYNTLNTGRRRWTSRSRASLPSHAWFIIDSSLGTVAKTNHWNVILVRGAQ